MKPIPIPFRSNPGDEKILGEPKVVNAYVQSNGNDSKASFSLVPVAGMKTFGPSTKSKCRGLAYLDDDNAIYAVLGGELVSYDSAGTQTDLGLIAGDENVSIAKNDADPQQIVIVGGGFVYQIENGAIAYLPLDFLEDGVSPKGVTFCGGRFVFWLDDGTFYWSDINSTNVKALNFATAQSDPDGLVSAHGVANTLYLVGENTTEVWSVTENADAPFARVPGAELRIGTGSQHSVKSFDNQVIMVGSDNAVYLLSGYQSQAISSNEVAKLIENETDKSVLVGFTHLRGVNRFFTLQGGDWTREYNAATGEWHDREDKFGNQWHCLHSVMAWGRQFFGDRQTGQLFEGDYSLYTDDGEVLSWGFDSPIIHSSPDGLSFDRVCLDMEAGDGISVSEAAEVMLSWSDDNKRTFKQERRLSLGKTGEYGTRVESRRLGQCSKNGRTFRVRVTDPVKRAIAGMYAMAELVEL